MAVFAIAGNPNKSTMFPTSRHGIRHGNDVIYGGLVSTLFTSRFDLWVLAEGSDRHNRVDHFWRLKRGSSIWNCSSLQAAFVEVWIVLYCCAVTEWDVYCYIYYYYYILYIYLYINRRLFTEHEHSPRPWRCLVS